MRCEKWLSEFFTQNGIVLCNDVREEARRQNFSKAELKQARKNLGVKTFHQFDESGDTGNHFWYVEVEVR